MQNRRPGTFGSGLVRLIVGTVTTGLLAAGLLLAPATPATAQEPSDDQAALQAAGWLARQLEANDYVMPDFSGSPGTRDFGLTIDALFVLAAAGVGGDVADQVVDKIQTDGWQYLQYQNIFGGDDADVGALAKITLALQVAGEDTSNFDVSQLGGENDIFGNFPEGTTTIDLVEHIRSIMQEDGSFGIYSNHFDQTLAVLAMARTPEGVDPAALAHLGTFQCLDESHPDFGGFGFFPGDSACSSVDGDAVGFLLSGMLGAGKTANDPEVQNALAWMQNTQSEDGSFPAGFSGLGNSNSTGLIANAARELGTPEALAVADSARSYVGALQIDCSAPLDIGGSGGFDPDWIGAIAYNQDGFDSGASAGVQTWESDTWRRASAQAALSLGELPGFSELTTAGMAAEAPAADDCQLSGEAPTIEGEAVVGNELTGVPGELGPAFEDVETEMVWMRGGAEVGAGETYTVQPRDVGKPLIVRVRALADDYAPASLDSEPVEARKLRSKVQVRWTVKPKKGKKGMLEVTVKPTEPGIAVSDGRVTIRSGKVSTTRVVKRSTHIIGVKGLKPGKRKVKITYVAGSAHENATKVIKVRVKR